MEQKIEIPVGTTSFMIQAYFFLGILSAFSLRAILIANHYYPPLAKFFWYFGIIGYLIFFMHRYEIAQRRYRIIKKLDLLDKIEGCTALDPDVKKALKYVLWSVSISKERLNYMIISAFSVVAIAIALMLDFGIIY